MSRRLVVLAVSMLAFATVSLAADPIIGTWKLNVAKSTFSQKNPTVLKERTVIYRVIDPGQIEMTESLVRTDGSSHIQVQSFPQQGGNWKCIRDCIDQDEVAVQALVTPGEWYVIALRDGKQIATRHLVVSKDGKTLTHTITFVDAQGNTGVDRVMFFEKQ